MDLGPLRDIVLDITDNVCGVPASVTRPGETSFTTTVIWAPSELEELPDGSDLNRRSPRRVLALRRDEVPTIPLDSRISAPEKDDPTGTARLWKVDGYSKTDRYHHFVLVVPTQT